MADEIQFGASVKVTGATSEGDTGLIGQFGIVAGLPGDEGLPGHPDHTDYNVGIEEDREGAGMRGICYSHSR